MIILTGTKPYFSYKTIIDGKLVTELNSFISLYQRKYLIIELKQRNGILRILVVLNHVLFIYF